MSHRNLAIKRKLKGDLEPLIEKLSGKLKDVGFGVLTRIDFDTKIEEKLGKKIPRTVVLGICNPGLAYEAYQQTTDVTLLIPCNPVLRQEQSDWVLEVMRPLQMLAFLPEVKNSELIQQAEANLEKVIESL